MDAAMIQGEDHSVSERRAAQQRRIAERDAIMRERNPMVAWVRRGAPDDDVTLAHDVFIVPVWQLPAEGLAPHDAGLLRWMLFGVAPIAALGCSWLLGANLDDAGLLALVALAVDCTVLLLALLVALALGNEYLGRTSPATTRRFIRVATFSAAVVGIVTLAVSLILTTRAAGPSWWPLIRAFAPLLCLGVALIRYRGGLRRHRAIERLAQRCGLEVHVGARALRRWLDRCWEGEASTEQLVPRSNSAYLVAGRIEGFDVAIELRLDKAPRSTQILVAAALDPATHGFLTESLRASGFTAEASAAGVVASPQRVDRSAIRQGRDDALGLLRDGTHGIVAFLVRAGVRPPASLAQ
jgi:hypothetical protein